MKDSGIDYEASRIDNDREPGTSGNVASVALSAFIVAAAVVAWAVRWLVTP